MKIQLIAGDDGNDNCEIYIETFQLFVEVGFYPMFRCNKSMTFHNRFNELGVSKEFNFKKKKEKPYIKIYFLLKTNSL